MDKLSKNVPKQPVPIHGLPKKCSNFSQFGPKLWDLSTGPSRRHSTQYMIYHIICEIKHPNQPWTVMAAPIFVSKIISIRSQGLGPIKRPLTASFDSNIDKALKEGIKPKWGETPNSRSLRKLPKSGTHAKPSPRRAVLLLVPKTADGRIARYSREKSLSL